MCVSVGSALCKVVRPLVVASQLCSSVRYARLCSYFVVSFVPLASLVAAVVAAVAASPVWVSVVLPDYGALSLRFAPLFEFVAG